MVAVRSGKIVKPSRCESCRLAPEPRELHGHHDDYSQPFAVRWLCRECHVRHHVEANVPRL
jgi:hypothetical protein